MAESLPHDIKQCGNTRHDSISPNCYGDVQRRNSLSSDNASIELAIRSEDHTIQLETKSLSRREQPKDFPELVDGVDDAGEVKPPSNQAQPSSEESEAYSIFTTSQKRLIVLTASFCGFFSPVTASIYYPALQTIAEDLHVSNTAINLTVTTYLVSGLFLDASCTKRF